MKRSVDAAEQPWRGVLPAAAYSAAALATLDLFEKPGFLEGLPGRCDALGERLKSLHQHPCVADIRRYGFAAGIELQADPQNGVGFESADRVGARVCQAAGRLGVFLRPLGDVIVLMPPLTLTDAELDRLVDAIDQAIAEVVV